MVHFDFSSCFDDVYLSSVVRLIKNSLSVADSRNVRLLPKKIEGIIVADSSRTFNCKSSKLVFVTSYCKHVVQRKTVYADTIYGKISICFWLLS